MPSKKSPTKKAAKKKVKSKHSANTSYPAYSLLKATRIPQAIFDQNAGNPCTQDEIASYLKLSSGSGPFAKEIRACVRFGLIKRNDDTSNYEITELARRIIKPESDDDKVKGLQEAVLKCPVISDVYSFYKNASIPDDQFFKNKLSSRTFNIPEDKFPEFRKIFFDTLECANLIKQKDDQYIVLNPSSDELESESSEVTIARISKEIKTSKYDSCFVIMPFSKPHNSYYELVYKKAIDRSGLSPYRADSEIFGTGKVMSQIWEGINAAKVLIADLTTKNANVLYELGIAHALQKPVILVAENIDDVPFDLKHNRIVLYDKDHPSWGDKLIESIYEKILLALSNPEENIFKF